MKDIKYFNDFSKGLVVDIDPRDIPDNAVYSGSKNFHIDGSGRLSPLKKTASTPSYGYAFNQAKPFINPDGDNCLVFHNTTQFGVYNESSSTIEDKTGVVTDTPIISANTIRFPKGTSHAPSIAYYAPVDRVNNIAFYSNGGRDKLVVDASVNTIATTKYVKIFTPSKVKTTSNVTSVTPISGDGNYYTVIVNAPSHGLVASDKVIITNSEFNFTDQAGEPSEDSFNGEYTVNVINADSFSFTSEPSQYTGDGSEKPTTLTWEPVDEMKFGYGDSMPSNWTDIARLGEKYNIGDGIEISFSSVAYSKVGDYWVITTVAKNSTLYIEDLDVDNHVDPEAVKVFPSQGAVGNTFTTDKSYYYAFSFEYEDFQNSSLVYNVDTRITPSVNRKEFNVRIELDKSKLSHRTKSINIWKADSNNNIYEPTTYFRLVKTINLESDLRVVDGNKYKFDFVDVGNDGASYEAMIGIPDNIKNPLPNYTYASVLNNYLFIGDVYHSSVSDNASSMLIARSQENAFDTFDLSTDILKMPFTITSIESYNGKLIVFGNNQLAIVNQNLFIEDIYEGKGSENNKILVTEDGLYFGNSEGFYLLTSKGIVELSTYIKSKWKELYSYIVSLHYDISLNAIVIVTNNYKDMLLYYPQFQSWSIFETPFSNRGITGGWTGAKGDTFFGTYNSIAGGQTYQGFSGESYSITLVKPVYLDSPDESKKWYRLYINGNTPASGYNAQFAVGESDIYIDIINSNIKYEDKWIKAKSLKFKFSTIANINNMSIFFRRLKSRTTKETNVGVS